MKRLFNRIQLVRRLGLGWVLWRAWYTFVHKTGILKRRFPAVDAAGTNLSTYLRGSCPSKPEEFYAYFNTRPICFLIELGSLPSPEVLGGIVGEHDRARTIKIADDYREGRFLYYSRHVHDLGWPVNWLLNPFTGGQHHAKCHWCDYPTFSAEAGDIKDVWEPSRFACAFWLVRAYALTRDEKYPQCFWELFESWCEQNPPNMGPNWKCGQEAALRCFAWCFALYGFWKSSSTTPQRVAGMVKMLAIHGQRIAGNIGYAISQKNNHGISEAAGLLTIGLLFPELKEASRWVKIGTHLFEQEVRRQIYDDGSYVQQSMNYHRVMLHDCLWAVRLAELNHHSISQDVKDRISRAGEFLFEMLDESSGHVPNYGANDGALVLPLSACDYSDYRPVVQMARYQGTGWRVLDSGPWDEALLWLYGSEALDVAPAPESASSRRFDAGGYYTIRGRDSWCMVRCHSYRDRPAHVDMLHVDLWHKGVNVFGDSGTYKYYVPNSPGLERYFKDIRAHNTIEVDGRGPLDLFSRFLWLPWPKAHCLKHEQDCWQGVHHGYDRKPWNVIHERSVQCSGDDGWLISDELQGTGDHAITLRWHMADGVYCVDKSRHHVELNMADSSVAISFEGIEQLDLDVARGRDEAGNEAGWESVYYSEISPKPSIIVTGTVRLPCRLSTRITFLNA